jgi:hypothetical protein
MTPTPIVIFAIAPHPFQPVDSLWSLHPSDDSINETFNGMNACDNLRLNAKFPAGLLRHRTDSGDYGAVKGFLRPLVAQNFKKTPEPLMGW